MKLSNVLAFAGDKAAARGQAASDVLLASSRAILHGDASYFADTMKALTGKTRILLSVRSALGSIATECAALRAAPSDDLAVAFATVKGVKAEIRDHKSVALLEAAAAAIAGKFLGYFDGEQARQSEEAKAKREAAAALKEAEAEAAALAIEQAAALAKEAESDKQAAALALVEADQASQFKQGKQDARHLAARANTSLKVRALRASNAALAAQLQAAQATIQAMQADALAALAAPLVKASKVRATKQAAAA